jgi:hypothetical protein
MTTLSKTAKTLLAILIVTFATALTNQTSTYAFSGSGTGTQEDPYQIGNCAALLEMADELDAHYTLVNNINCADSANWGSPINEGYQGFDPIGDSGTPFTGSFDGNNFTISNLYIDRVDDNPGQDESDEEYVGLFGYMQDAAVNDVSLTNARIRGYRYVGGIVGYANNSTITNTDVNVGATASDCNPGYCVWARWGQFGGGIAGTASNVSIIEDVNVGGAVKGSGNSIGGIVGSLNDSFATGSTTTATVDGGANIGGAFGEIYASTVTDVSAQGNVFGIVEIEKSVYNIGGFSGSVYNSEITGSSATGDIDSAGETVGGFAGFSGCGSTISDSYATGNVVAAAGYVGGFTGQDGCEGPGTTYDSVYADGDVQGTHYVGGLVGQGYITKIYDSYATGNITASGNEVGGLVGVLGGFGTEEEEQYWSIIQNSYATGNVEGGDLVGGLVGNVGGAWVNEGDLGVLITRTYAEGEITGANYVGGLVGKSIIGVIEESYTTGDVEATGSNIGGFIGEVRGDATVSNAYATGNVNSEGSYAAGFVGTVYQGNVYNSYASGNVTLTGPESDRAGGFIAEAYEATEASVELYNNFSTGLVSAPSEAGGFAATVGGITLFQNNYWDISRSGIDTCLYNLGTEGCVGVNELGDEPLYFINNADNSPLDEWDFESDLWQTYETGYPCFVWQELCFEPWTPGQDSDNDGESDTIEDLGPNDGDANADGTPDSEQANVISYVNPLTGQYAVFEAVNCESIAGFQVGAESPEVSDKQFDYPMGLLSFQITCENPGDTAVIRQYFYGIEGTNQYVLRKWMPDGSYRTLPGYMLMGMPVENHGIVFLVEYEITDGGEFDDDGEVNGVIVDPSGLALAAGTSDTAEENGLASSGAEFMWLYVATSLLVLSILTRTVNHRTARKT